MRGWNCPFQNGRSGSRKMWIQPLCLTENSRNWTARAKWKPGGSRRQEQQKMGLKKKTRQEHGTPKWGWLEDLYLSQKKKKKIKPHSLELWSCQPPNSQLSSFSLTMRLCFRSWKPRTCISWGVWYFSTSIQETITSCGHGDSLCSFKIPHTIRGVLRMWRAAQAENLISNMSDGWSPLWPNP